MAPFLHGCFASHFEQLLNIFLGFCRAFHEGVSLDSTRYRQGLFRADGLLFHEFELLHNLWILAQVSLVAHQDDGHPLAKMLHLLRPLRLNICQAVRTTKEEAALEFAIWISILYYNITTCQR